MTPELLTKFAIEADPFGKDGRLYFMAVETPDTIAAFAALVAAHQRELDARICDDMVLYTGFDCAAAIRGTK